MTSPWSSLRGRWPFSVVALVGSIIFVVGGTTPSYAADGSSYLGTLNFERASHGLAPLHTSAALRQVAQAWAGQMASSGSLRHNPRLKSQIANWRVIGENVGRGGSMSSLVQAFWNSAEHRANILDRRFSQVGIGYVRRDRVIWIAVVFRAPMHVSSSTPSSPPKSSPPKSSTSASQPTRASSGDPRAWPGRLLALGSSGQTVAYVQRLLGLRADGLFGTRTRQAVLGFQRRHQLSADGIVGPITWSALLHFAVDTT